MPAAGLLPARLAAQSGPEMELKRFLPAGARLPLLAQRPKPYEPRCGARFSDWDASPKLERPASPDFRSRDKGMGTTRLLALLDLLGPAVTVVCASCPRRGVYQVARLLALFGPELLLPSVLRKLAMGCRERLEPTPPCSAIYDLALR